MTRRAAASLRHHSNAARAGSSRPAAVSAIAFSTWSHGSVWPPSNHGIAPEGSCVAAIDSAVWRHCAGVRTPGTPGTSGVDSNVTAGFSKYSATLLPISGFSTASAVRVSHGRLIMSHTSSL